MPDGPEANVRYVTFSAGFFLIHLAAYLTAGLVSQTYSAHLYRGEGALLRPFLRDVARQPERQRQARIVLPAQLVRAVAMSVVLYPLLEPLGELSYLSRAGFLAGLMFVYTALASAVPFPNTIEGVVYLQRRFVTRDAFLRIQSESLLYSLMFAGFASWLLFPV